MSTDDRGARTAIARLRREIAADGRAMAARAGEVDDVLARWQAAAPDRPHLIVAAFAVHAWYTGLEAALERIARELDGEVPTGDASHRALLSQAITEIEGVRPSVLPEVLEPDLISLLGFRHFFRHAYGAEIDPDKLHVEAQRLVRIAPQVAAALAAFDGFLASAERSLG